MIPSNAARHLARKKAALEQRRARLAANIAEIDGTLAEITNAEQALQAPRNGHAVKLPELLQALPITQKDCVLAAVRSRPKNGSTRQWIIHKLAQQKHPVGANNVSTYLTHLQQEGLVRYERGLWFPK
jgi:Tfp pilus assembly protein PilN